MPDEHPTVIAVDFPQDDSEGRAKKAEGPAAAPIAQVFHRVNRILPEEQDLLDVPPDMKARDALALMRERGFSQLPVRQGKEVLGLFSYRAFALEYLAASDKKADLAELSVDEFLEHEPPVYARLQDEFRGLIEVLDDRDAVMVSGERNLIGLLTPMDLLRYLYGVANAFVLIEEIELALRALIRRSVRDAETFSLCVANALSRNYGDGKLPGALEEMTFNDYVGLIRDGRNWSHFASCFGGTRERWNGRLQPVGKLRNDVFHFRREISAEDHQLLTSCRDWLLRRVRLAKAREEDNE